ncbi:MAG: DUF2207 domain-containing protein [Candidatus Methanoplasma sp.]|nr:DUF2207 domain-containing protein [Candidatus Methanoplasma sp.]
MSHGITRSRCVVFLFVAVVASAVLLATVAASQTADAKSYAMGPVDIYASVDADGTMSVSEKRTFDFNGNFTCVWWTFSSGSKYTIGDVSIAADGQTVQLAEVPFQEEWRISGGPGDNKYSIDRHLDDLLVYVFFNATDRKMTVELNYFLDIVGTYADVAELYWKFTSPDWTEESSDVNLTVMLPVPAGVSVAKGDIRAWGHGDPAGTVQPNDDGTVTYNVPIVYGGRFAEARVAFPVEWASGMAIQHDGNRLDEIIAEESAWAYPYQEDGETIYILIAFNVAITVAVAYATFLFFRKGREYKPQFDQRYWRDSPSEDHPAILGSLWRWGRVGTEEFTATLMRLTNMGVISLRKNVSPGGKTDDHYLSVDRSEAAKLADPIDRKAVAILFGKISKGADAVSVKEIAAYGKKNGKTLNSDLNDWKDTVKKRVEGRGYIESGSTDRSKNMFVMGTFVLFIALFLLDIVNSTAPSIFGDSPFLSVIPFAAGLAIMVVGVFMKRRSRAGRELHARCVALRNWLKDFTRLKEAVPEDVAVWNQYLVFAMIFGVADDVVKQLKIAMPMLAESMMYSPAYIWAYPGMGISPARAISDVLDNASGNSGNSHGYGGGFSGGGGGGFGGGGGGAR